MPPVERGWITFFVDRVFGWWSGLPRETSSYTTEFIQIPIGDVKLAANLYQPTTAPRGTILIRTSYGIAPLMALGNARMFASRGYQVLLAACRGTDPSDGQDIIPAVHEAQDGLATVAWMREQPWYTGSFATYGGSYLGHTQWAILTDPPPDMKAAIISTGPVDFGAFTWGTGAMETHMIAWAALMTAPKRGITPGLPYIRKLPQTLQPVYDSLPLMDGIKDHLQNNEPPWLEELISQSDTSTPFWSRANQSAALKKAKIPILQSTGWNDSVLPMILNQHSVLVEQGAPAFLTIGPWSHVGSQRGPTLIEGLQFFDYYLAGRGTAPRASPCRVFVTGLNEWRDLNSWPPLASSTRDFFLSPKTLSKEQPEQASSSSFTFNPNAATPPIGMPRPFDDVQPTNYNDTELAQRSDVAVFDTPPLESDIEVYGKPLIELHHSTDNPHADILVRLSEVDSRGKSTRISDVYKRLDPTRGPEPLSLALVDCAHVFRKGMKIRVIIAGGAHPAYLRNLGTGENQAYGATTKPAVHTIHHSKDAVSKLTLPVKARN
ncbi:Cocaine esterase [Fusarium oxysporum f. sp. cubense]|uniref:Cocaine esterase n=1 Tax=Fusarium oxysporum f. sp. cubense TaxID=61366 RepID=A0A559LKX0_FUSOC|nr:Cocaine esterase [Fusarium oxysporum f. sp. cubense]